VFAACQSPDIGRWSKDPRAPHHLQARAGTLHEGRAIGLGASRVYLVADVANTGSQHVAREAGFHQEGVLRSYLHYRDGSLADAALFSRVPTD